MVLGTIYADHEGGFRNFDQSSHFFDRADNAMVDRHPSAQKSLKSSTRTPSCTNCDAPVWQS